MSWKMSRLGRSSMAMSLMTAEPVPSTLTVDSSTVGVRPRIVTSFVPGCEGC